MIKVFIIDDHKMFIEGVALLLKEVKDISLVGFSTNASEAIQRIQELSVDIILLDINMPDINGIEACERLLKQNSRLKIIAISMHKESSLIKLMLSKGAKGYILKNAGQEELVKAIQTVHAGELYLDATVNSIVINSMTNQTEKKIKNPFPTLTRREKEILNLILEEYTTQEISDKLFISFGTVETHRRNMMIKLGARNTAGLVKTALEYELYK